MMAKGVAGFLAVLVFLGGCASISIRQVEEDEKGKPKNPPELIYVAPFDVEKAEFNVDREGEELKAFKNATAKVLQKAIAERIRKSYATAQEIDVSHKLPSSGWIIMGKFKKVNQGSRALRATIGFGAGGTKMETEVFVYDLSRRPPVPFLAFKTSGGSNAEPGFIVESANPISLATGFLGALGALAKGITDDSMRTSRMITAQLSQFLLKEGWITLDQASQPKVDGEVGSIIPE